MDARQGMDLAGLQEARLCADVRTVGALAGCISGRMALLRRGLTEDGHSKHDAKGKAAPQQS